MRLGSYSSITLPIRAVSARFHSPQPSLNVTQPTIDGTERCWSMIVFISCSQKTRDAGSVSPLSNHPLGMSCQTMRPSVSAWWYQRAGSTLMCLRTVLKPRSLCAWRSNTYASSDAGV
ncbi:Uncharacterised protein [Mycobacteroides abscessus]|nr:Uncharacterised protein [Mycobacteroides abscessus]